MTTTEAEQELLSSIQMLRVTNYERYAEILPVLTNWINSEIEKLSPETGKERKVIIFPGNHQRPE